MNTQLKLEEIAMFGFSIYLFSLTPYAWWYFPALLLVPDLGMIGYIFNTRLGAITYNLTHHKAIAVVVLMIGWYTMVDWVSLTGIILFGHAAMDRMLGYGLKYPDDFKHTHLGWIGNNQIKN